MGNPEYEGRNLAIIAELKKENPLTQSEVADLFGITRERVRQIVNRHEEKTGEKVRISKYPKDIKIKIAAILNSKLLGTAQDVVIAESFGVHQNFIMKLRNKQGIAPWMETRPTKCPRCETHPYALDMCKNCYMRDLRKRHNAR